MRNHALLVLLLLVGCGGSIGEIPPTPDAGIVVTGDPFGCTLAVDGCHCVIPAHSVQALVAMQERCDYLRAISADLY